MIHEDLVNSEGRGEALDELWKNTTSSMCDRRRGGIMLYMESASLRSWT